MQFISDERTAPVIVRDVEDVVAYEGAEAAFLPVLAGTIPTAAQWYFQGAQVPGATNTTLTLPSVAAEQAGAYQLRVSNDFGSAATATANLTVRTGFSAPRLSQQPQDQGVMAGVAVRFGAAATGSPAPALLWLFNGYPMPGATNADSPRANARPKLFIGSNRTISPMPCGSKGLLRAPSIYPSPLLTADWQKAPENGLSRFGPICFAVRFQW